MVFSKKWLYPSKSRFHQRYSKNVTNRVYTSIHKMSTGFLYTCISRSCSSSDSEKVTFIFLTLLLFPVNLWIYELKKNISVPIGWSYFIGWLVLVLYFTCGVLCYLNHKNFWSLMMSSSSSINNPSSSITEREGSLMQETLMSSPEQSSSNLKHIPDPDDDDQEDNQKPASLTNYFLGPYPASLG
ncbi:outer dense fiber protein 4 [Cricetulus griseus]|nr:outer dense fiber protein 4 [Cricetulus griseus]